ncbi:glycosyltransferase family 2 protein [Methanolobus halotolerans]|uniref:Glycosyltransferase 2-like domain-containing protein n=1 Tax=Methanolobus halotolerans TaxID=2052935 RepID=A0A4E0Q743_9EURY|nr:glycosyltransferase [Methanolobus halotolerans]TGC10613.1 hypothetical protein CUN85_03740 [Methanolobus halotolerans]
MANDKTLDKFPLVSIVILNYNGLVYLKKTLPPILELDYPNYECVIVDNGSIDGSVDYIKKHNRVKLIENGQNLGYSKGKNIGVKSAEGKFIFCLDEDILIRNKLILQDLIRFYDKAENPCFINVLLVDEADRFSIPIVSKQYGGYYGLFGIKENKKIDIDQIMKHGNTIETVIAFGGNMFFAKSNWNCLGGLDESQKFNLDDDDISTRARVLGFKNYLYNKDYLIHLGIERRVDNKKFRFKYKYYFSGKGKPIIKNFQLKTILWMFPLYTLKTTVKTLKQAINRFDPLLFYSFLVSMCIFIRDIKYTLEQRKNIQSKRLVNDTVFLRIELPQFD